MSSQIWPIVPYGAFTLATPTIPKFYWDVYSQEQRWKTICCELGKLIDYANAIGVQVNICAYIPSSWAGIMFDTGAVYGTDSYGCLILKY